MRVCVCVCIYVYIYKYFSKKKFINGICLNFDNPFSFLASKEDTQGVI